MDKIPSYIFFLLEYPVSFWDVSLWKKICFLMTFDIDFKNKETQCDLEPQKKL